jgi:hypothetical protein
VRGRGWGGGAKGAEDVSKAKQGAGVGLCGAGGGAEEQRSAQGQLGSGGGSTLEAWSGSCSTMGIQHGLAAVMSQPGPGHGVSYALLWVASWCRKQAMVVRNRRQLSTNSRAGGSPESMWRKQLTQGHNT